MAVDINEGFVYIRPQHENGVFDSCHHYQVAFFVSFLSLYVTFKGRINLIHEASPSNRLRGPCVINGILAGMRSPIIKVDAIT